ncbi:replication factor c subunit [Anaeramoeba flamelloides]|uniref:Replication factor c subunit n=1 Tax=Anaeramoeba flamelloides TaxID=1746091 RepID=A0AAV7ZHF0_9EUKA|nr:replication factor c subunit [Anaeramoeba flamelloides]
MDIVEFLKENEIKKNNTRNRITKGRLSLVTKKNVTKKKHKKLSNPKNFKKKQQPTWMKTQKTDRHKAKPTDQNGSKLKQTNQKKRKEIEKGKEKEKQKEKEKLQGLKQKQKRREKILHSKKSDKEMVFSNFKNKNQKIQNPQDLLNLHPKIKKIKNNETTNTIQRAKNSKDRNKKENLLLSDYSVLSFNNRSEENNKKNFKKKSLGKIALVKRNEKKANKNKKNNSQAIPSLKKPIYNNSKLSSNKLFFNKKQTNNNKVIVKKKGLINHTSAFSAGIGQPFLNHEEIIETDFSSDKNEDISEDEIEKEKRKVKNKDNNDPKKRKIDSLSKTHSFLEIVSPLLKKNLRQIKNTPDMSNNIIPPPLVFKRNNSKQKVQPNQSQNQIKKKFFKIKNNYNTIDEDVNDDRQKNEILFKEENKNNNSNFNAARKIKTKNDRKSKSKSKSKNLNKITSNNPNNFNLLKKNPPNNLQRIPLRTSESDPNRQLVPLIFTNSSKKTSREMKRVDKVIYSYPTKYDNESPNQGNPPALNVNQKNLITRFFKNNSLNYNKTKINDATLWTEKYRPKHSSKIVGNFKIRNQLKNWIQCYPNHSKKAVLLSGQPGIGKTTMAIIISKELGYMPIEMNASDVRSEKILRNKIEEITQSKNIFTYFTTFRIYKNKKNILIMDEVDGMSGGDYGGMSKLNKIINQSKIPIICICNDRNLDKVRTLSKNCLDLRFKEIHFNEGSMILSNICQKEGFNNIPENILKNLIQQCNGDLRRSINMLQTLCISSKDFKINSINNSNNLNNNYNHNNNNYNNNGHNHNNINNNNTMTNKSSIEFLKREQMVNEIKKIESFHQNTNLFEVTRLFFQSFYPKTFHLITIKNKTENFFRHYNIIPYFIFENYPRSLPKINNQNYQNHQYFNNYKNSICSISLGDLIFQKIMSKQKWNLLEIYGILSCIKPGMSLNNGFGNNKIAFPMILGNMNKTNRRKRELDQIQEKIQKITKTNKKDFVLDYLPIIKKKIAKPLIINRNQDIINQENKGKRINKIIKILHFYDLNRQDWDILIELSNIIDCSLTCNRNIKIKPSLNLKNINSQIKRDFTRKINSITVDPNKLPKKKIQKIKKNTMNKSKKLPRKSRKSNKKTKPKPKKQLQKKSNFNKNDFNTLLSGEFPRKRKNIEKVNNKTNLDPNLSSSVPSKKKSLMSTLKSITIKKNDELNPNKSKKPLTLDHWFKKKTDMKNENNENKIPKKNIKSKKIINLVKKPKKKIEKKKIKQTKKKTRKNRLDNIKKTDENENGNENENENENKKGKEKRDEKEKGKEKEKGRDGKEKPEKNENEKEKEREKNGNENGNENGKEKEKGRDGKEKPEEKEKEKEKEREKEKKKEREREKEKEKRKRKRKKEKRKRERKRRKKEKRRKEKRKEKRREKKREKRKRRKEKHKEKKKKKSHKKKKKSKKKKD